MDGIGFTKLTPDAAMRLDPEQLRRTLELSYGPATPHRPEFVQDSVILLLVNRRDGTRLVAVQKADREGYHWRNQLALPGGRIDPDDTSATDAGLRELEEELGICRDCVEVLGSLGRFHTNTSNHELEVIVGLWSQDCAMKIDRQEIARVFGLPVADLVRLHTGRGYRRQGADHLGERLVYPIENVTIWGVTARILHHFLEMICQDSCQVTRRQSR